MPSATSVSVKLSQGELFEILPLKLILAQQGNQQNELDLILKPDSLLFHGDALGTVREVEATTK